MRSWRERNFKLIIFFYFSSFLFDRSSTRSRELCATDGHFVCALDRRFVCAPCSLYIDHVYHVWLFDKESSYMLLVYAACIWAIHSIASSSIRRSWTIAEGNFRLRNQLGLFEGIWDRSEPFESTWKHLEPFETVLNQLKPFETTWNHLKVFEGIQDPRDASHKIKLSFGATVRQKEFADLDRLGPRTRSPALSGCEWRHIEHRSEHWYENCGEHCTEHWPYSIVEWVTESDSLLDALRHRRLKRFGGRNSLAVDVC